MKKIMVLGANGMAGHTIFEYLDSLPVKYCDGNPNFPSANIFFETTAGDYKTRNGPTGLNYRVIGNMCIIVIYQYWEDQFRPELARLLGRNISDITSDIMGDIRYLRNSIIHHASIALKEIENTKLLQWYKEGDEIFINEDQYKTIISHIQSYIESFRQDFG